MLKHPRGVSCRFKASWRKKMTPHLHLAHLAHTQTKSNDHEWSLSEAHNSRCGIGESDWINLNQSESVQKNPRSTSEIFRDRPMFWALGISWLPLMGGRDVRAKCQASWNAARLFPRSYATWSSLSHQPHSWHQLTKSMIPELRVGWFGWAPRRY